MLYKTTCATMKAKIKECDDLSQKLEVSLAKTAQLEVCNQI